MLKFDKQDPPTADDLNSFGARIGSACRFLSIAAATLFFLVLLSLLSLACQAPQHFAYAAEWSTPTVYSALEVNDDLQPSNVVPTVGSSNSAAYVGRETEGSYNSGIYNEQGLWKDGERKWVVEIRSASDKITLDYKIVGRYWGENVGAKITISNFVLADHPNNLQWRDPSNASHTFSHTLVLPERFCGVQYNYGFTSLDYTLQFYYSSDASKTPINIDLAYFTARDLDGPDGDPSHVDTTGRIMQYFTPLAGWDDKAYKTSDADVTMRTVGGKTSFCGNQCLDQSQYPDTLAVTTSYSGKTMSFRFGSYNKENIYGFDFSTVVSPPNVSVRYVLDGNTSSPVHAANVKANSEFATSNPNNATATTKAQSRKPGAHISKWHLDSAYEDVFDSTLKVQTKAITLYAYSWVVVKFNYKNSANAAKTQSNDIDWGAKTPYPNASADRVPDGYRFDGWKDDATGTLYSDAQIAAMTFKQDKSFTAQYTQLAPSISLAKSASPTSGELAAGDTISYTLTATNTGNTTLAGVSIADHLDGVRITSTTFPNGNAQGTLNPGEKATATATYSVKQTDVDASKVVNTATATGRCSETGRSVSDDAEATTTIQTRASLSISKTVDKAGLAGDAAIVGTVLTYTMKVSNTGTTTIDDVSIDDSLSGNGLSAISFDWGSTSDASTGANVLAPGESVTATATYSVRQSDIDAGKAINEATATGTDRKTNDVVRSNKASVTTTIEQIPSISLRKSVSPSSIAGDSAAVGKTIEFAFAIENTGNATLTNVAVSDALAGLSAVQISWPSSSGVLAPGETATGKATYSLKQSDIDAGAVSNSATATGISPNGEKVEDDGSATATIEQRPAISLDKTASPSQISGDAAAAGKAVKFSFTIRNTGNTTLTGVSIADHLAGVSPISIEWTEGAGKMSPGRTVVGTATYALRQADIDAGTLANTATVSGMSPSGKKVEDDGKATIGIEQRSSLDIVKSVNATMIPDPSAGDVIAYTITVRNTGNTTAHDVAVIDDKHGLSPLSFLGGESNGRITLAPDETATAKATYALTQNDIDAGATENTAKATGKKPDGSSITPVPESQVETKLVRNPNVEVEKRSIPGELGAVPAGTQIDYEVTVSNTGNTTVADIDVIDELIADEPIASIASMKPGDVFEKTVEYTLTQVDIDRGYVLNEVRLEIGDPGYPNVPPPRIITTDIGHDPIIDVVKTASPEHIAYEDAVAGTRIDYEISVTNKGNVTLTSVDLEDETDPVFGTLGALDIDWDGSTDAATPAGTLSPGETVRATISLAATVDGISNGEIVNVAKATGNSPKDVAVKDEDDAKTSIERISRLEIDKTSDTVLLEGVDACAGTEIEYDISITNAGNTVIGNVSLDDALEGVEIGGIDWSGCVRGDEHVLLPGETASASARYVLAQEDVDRGTLENVATVVGEGVGNAPDPDPASDDHNVVVEGTPAISIEKTAEPSKVDDDDAVPGTAIEYRFDIENIGTETLHDVVVEDELEGLSDVAIDWDGSTDAATPDGTLSPGEKVVGSASYSITQDDIDAGGVWNTAIARATSPDGTPIEDDGSEDVDIAWSPILDFAKVANEETLADARAGDVVSFSFAVLNSGNVTVSDIYVSDDLEGMGKIEWTSAYEGVEAITQAGSAFAAEAEAGSEAAEPGEKSFSPNGSEALENAAEEDGAFDDEGDGDGADGETESDNASEIDVSSVLSSDGTAVLAPGQMIVGTAEYVLTQEDVDAGEVVNVARAQGGLPDGSPVESDDDDALVSLPPSPAYSIVKEADKLEISASEPGEIITYSFAVTNTGNVTLHDVAIIDSLSGAGLSAISYDWDGSGDAATGEGVLSPGETVSATATYAITKDDIDAGEVVNTAFVDAKAPNGEAAIGEPDSVATSIRFVDTSGFVAKMGDGGYGAAAGCAAVLILSVSALSALLASRRRGKPEDRR